jgi:hypothetical protein
MNLPNFATNWLLQLQMYFLLRTERKNERQVKRKSSGTTDVTDRPTTRRVLEKLKVKLV